VSAIDRSGGNRRVLWLLVLTAAALFAGSVLFIVSRAQP
jgi:uncharacterized membrane protein